MVVRELIELLSKEDPELQVHIDHSAYNQEEGDFADLEKQDYYSDDRGVWLG